MEMQMMTIVAIKTTGNRILSTSNPKEAAFISFIPCVRGKMFANFCNIAGITSYGNVAPENISIGKYNTLATTPAIFVFGAMPPTIMPMLNMDTITKI